ncbi:arf-GAP with coiled-coil, ANK repeat and PH domain-containing protein 1-like [Ascaphus truei]|uniref:arf-GAP with coiled-coil, ANK repeat and PH domain-containing protein 1-like n=1 Tax=Ascaphus truei TaxID=8439 RepID=UPI003F5A12DB
MLQAESERVLQLWVSAVQRSITTAYSDTKRESGSIRLSRSPTEAPAQQRGGECAQDAVLRVPGNAACCDCRGAEPEWASINLGVTLCIECSGIHRSLGVHFSKVRSLTLDSWEPELIKLMRELGNNTINGIYEARTEEMNIKKPTSCSSRSEKEIWIRAKYVEKKFITKLPQTALRSVRHHGNQPSRPISSPEERPISSLETEPENNRPMSSPDTQPGPSRPINRPGTLPAINRPISRPGTKPENIQPISRPGTQPENNQPISRPGTQPENNQPISRPGTQPENIQPISRPGTQPENNQPISRPGTQPENNQPISRPGTQPENNQPISRLRKLPKPMLRPKPGTAPPTPGAGPDVRSLHPGALLYRAAEHHYLPTMADALAHGADVNWVRSDEDGRTPLIRAVLSDSLVACEFLLQNGASVNQADKDGRGPLHHATLRGYTG